MTVEWLAGDTLTLSIRRQASAEEVATTNRLLGKRLPEVDHYLLSVDVQNAAVSDHYYRLTVAARERAGATPRYPGRVPVRVVRRVHRGGARARRHAGGAALGADSSRTVRPNPAATRHATARRHRSGTAAACTGRYCPTRTPPRRPPFAGVPRAPPDPSSAPVRPMSPRLLTVGLFARVSVALLALGTSGRLAAQRVDSVPAGAPVVAPGVAPGGAPVGVPLGARVRVTRQTAVTPRAVGTLVGADTSGLAIAVVPGAAPERIARWDVARLEQFAAPPRGATAFRRGAVRGALFGAAVGAVATAAMAVHERRTPCRDCMITGTAAFAVATVPLTAVTTLLGGTVALAQRGRWVPVRLR